MKKLKVLALCAVLVGLGGAMSALTAAQEEAAHDFFVDMAVHNGVTKDQAEMAWGMMGDSDKEVFWELSQSGYDYDYGDGDGDGDGGSGSGGGSSPAPSALPGYKSLKGRYSYTAIKSPKSQSGLVSEVGDYMDVNSWQGVEFDKLFAHVGYNIDGKFNGGAATRIGGLYTGLFFYGNIIDSETDTTKRDKIKGTSVTTDTLSDQVMQFSALVGIGNLGIKASMLFAPESGNVSSKSTNDGKTYKSTTNAYEILPQVDVGFNLSLDSLALTPHAHLGFDFNPNKTTIKDVNGNTTYGGSSVTWTLLGFGSGLELPQKSGSIVTHSFSADLDFAFRSKLKTFSGTNTVIGDTGFTLGSFSLGWTGNFAVADNLGFKLAATLPIEWAVITSSNDGQKASGTDIAPTLTASLKYQVTQKFVFGLSADLTLPALEFASAGAGNNKGSSVRFNAEDFFALEFDAGFRFDLTQNVTFDCGWSFGGNLLNNYLKTVSDNSPTFWKGLSYIFSDIQLGLSMKF